MTDLKIYDPRDFPPYLPKLSRLYDDLLTSGKGFRAELVKRVCNALELVPSEVALLRQTIEFVHNSSLLHDDLVDRTPLRRNKPAAWVKYTPEYAVLAGDYLLARVMVNLSQHGSIKLVQLTANMISDLLEGEWIQDSLVGDFNIQLDQLDQVHRLKTSSLFKWCLQAPFICRKTTDEELMHILAEAGNILGLIFQRADDLLDFDIRNSENKTVLTDLKSGYLNSFATFLLRDQSPDVRQLVIHSQSLGEIQKHLTEKFFFDQVSLFDKMNQEKIELYEHYIQQVSLKIASPQFVRDLKPIANKLYFRN